MIPLTRDPGPLHLPGIRAAGLRSLLDALECPPGRLVAADLGLGAWRSHQAAAEISRQLGLPGPLGPPAVPAGPRPSRIGRLIDRDTRGDPIVLEALRLAGEVWEAVATQGQVVFCVLAPRYGLGWERGDTFFVRFLAQALRSSPHRLVLATGEEAPGLPAGWSVSWLEAAPAGALGDGDAGPAALVPGVLTPAVAAALNVGCGEGLLRLRGGCLLVAPELRRDVRTVEAERLDDLALRAREIPWLAAYASCHGGASVRFLWEHARHELEAGGLGIALRLLARAVERARTPAERAVFELLAQGARIAGGRFVEAAELPDPSPELPAELSGWLSHTKGWALTLLERPSEAEPHLARARELLRSSGEREEYLYVLNISALNLLRLGDWNGARALEEEIRASLQGVASGTWQLRYINSLNLARLYRQAGDLAAVEGYYHEAFATASGARSDGDALYRNVCQARVEEARGRPAEAFAAWLRAALCWVSSTAPEAIGRRFTAAVLGPGRRPDGEVTDGVATALLAHLAAGAAAAALEREARVLGDPAPPPAPAFLRPELLPPAAAAGIWHALRLAGRWVLATRTALPPVLASPAGERLRAALHGLLALGDPAAAGLRAVLVDDQLGCDLPASEAELLAACLRLGLREVWLEGRPVRLDGEARDRWEAALLARSGSAVDRLETGPGGTFVVFKRYLEPRRLEPLECRLLGLVTGAALPVGALRAAYPDALPILRSLERDRAVELRLPEGTRFFKAPDDPSQPGGVR